MVLYIYDIYIYMIPWWWEYHDDIWYICYIYIYIYITWYHKNRSKGITNGGQLSYTVIPTIELSYYVCWHITTRVACVLNGTFGWIKNWFLTHWGRVTHICVGNLTIIGSDNGLPPGRRQAITCTNVWILLIGPLGTNFSEMLIEILTCHSRKSIWKCRLENGGHFVSA